MDLAHPDPLGPPALHPPVSQGVCGEAEFGSDFGRGQQGINGPARRTAASTGDPTRQGGGVIFSRSTKSIVATCVRFIRTGDHGYSCLLPGCDIARPETPDRLNRR